MFDRITGDFAVPLERDDCLILYTDGVTEALDGEGRRIRPGAHDAIRPGKRTERRAGDHRRLIDDLRSFVGATPQNDDITLIAIRKT